MRLVKSYTTHMPTLMKLVLGTEGPILELGSGLFSTPLLHWMCSWTGRPLVTYENTIEHYKFAFQFRSRYHRICFVDDWEKIQTDRHWGIVFIDHHPGNQRYASALRFKDSCDYMIIHDTEEAKIKANRFDEVFPHFNNRYDHGRVPRTTVLSNLSLDFIDKELNKHESIDHHHCPQQP